jgi:nitrite reductase (NO-forming)
MEPGERIYSTICIACHQSDAKGVPAIFPPLAGSDFLMADKDRSIAVLLHGLKGNITVNGSRFDGVMPQLPLRDAEIAAVLTYVRSHFGNRGSPVLVADVSRVRNAARSPRSPRAPSIDRATASSH